MSWNGLLDQLEAVSTRIAGLSDEADAVADKIDLAQKKLEALQQQQRGQPVGGAPDMLAQTALTDRFGEALPLGAMLPGKTTQQMRGLMDQFQTLPESLESRLNQPPSTIPRDQRPAWAKGFSANEWQRFQADIAQQRGTQEQNRLYQEQVNQANFDFSRSLTQNAQLPSDVVFLNGYQTTRGNLFRDMPDQQIRDLSSRLNEIDSRKS